MTIIQDGFESCDLAGWVVENNLGGTSVCDSQKPRTGLYALHQTVPAQAGAFTRVRKTLEAYTSYVKIASYVNCKYRHPKYSGFPELRINIPETVQGGVNYESWSETNGYIYFADGSRKIVAGIGLNDVWHLVEFWYDNGFISLRIDGILKEDSLDAKTTKQANSLWLAAFTWGGQAEGFFDDLEIEYTPPLLPKLYPFWHLKGGG
jgi:hypothetical protein